MPKPLEIGLIAGGATMLFGACYIGFAQMTGVPMHTLTVVGRFFEAPEPVVDPVADLSNEPARSAEEQLLYPEKPTPDRAQELIGASLGVIGSFAVPAPFDRDQLTDLAEELETRKAEIQARAAGLDDREETIEEQLLFLQERWAEIDSLRETIETRAAELEIAASDVETARKQLEQQRLASQRDIAVQIERKAALFQEGGASTAADRLLPLGAQEAGQILQRLEPERAREILDELPKDEWQAFADAYTGGA